MRVFLRIKELPETVRPCHVWRERGMTLLKADPRETRLTLTQWCVDNLTPQERDAFLEAFGVLSGAPAEDWMTDDDPAFLYVPPALRVPGDPPLQGGRELARRFHADALVDETAAYMAETARAARGA